MDIYRAKDSGVKYKAPESVISKRHELFIAMGFRYSEVTRTYYNTDILHTTKRDYMERWEEDQFIDVVKHIISKYQWMKLKD